MRQLIIALAIMIGFGANAATPSAASILNDAAKKISSMPSMTASFTISEQGRTVPGNITLSGDRFALTTKGAQSTWYDGRTQWVYNPAVEEISISTPTPDELATVNPFVIIKSFQKAYTARQLSAPAGSYVIQLTPTSKKSDISGVTLTINSSTKLPTKAVIALRSGSKATIDISNIKSGAKLPQSRFAPNKKDYPKAEFVDLR